MITTAILVDGAFYRKRATALFGEKTPKDRADELIEYCHRHINTKDEKANLYRIFYYDCLPSEKVVYHPLSQKSVNLKATALHKWTMDFYVELKKKRKVALRMGELLDSSSGYHLKPEMLKKLCKGTITISDLTEYDFILDIKQKGVDMKIGLDISSLAYKRFVNQIILIAGDSDFVPAAKHARREGIDFILDPLWHNIKPSLHEHIDGLHSCTPKPQSAINNDRLCNKQEGSKAEVTHCEKDK